MVKMGQSRAKNPLELTGRRSTQEGVKSARGLTTRKPAGLTTLRPRKCRHCGAKYRPTRDTQRFCSKACRQAAWAREKPRTRRQGDAIEPATCEHCGRTFWRREGRGRRYCSSSCRVMSSRVRKQATIRAFSEYTGKSEQETADIADASTAALKGMQTFLTARGLVYEPSRRAWVATFDRPTTNLGNAATPTGESRRRDVTPKPF